MIGKNAYKYCKEVSKIENYELALKDPAAIWECHHRLEFMPFSGKNCTMKRLIELDMYYNVQPEALLFLRRKDHRILHKEQFTTKNWKASSIQKLKNSIANKGKQFSEEHKEKLSEAHKGKHWKVVNGKRIYY